MCLFQDWCAGITLNYLNASAIPKSWELLATSTYHYNNQYIMVNLACILGIFHQLNIRISHSILLLYRQTRNTTCADSASISLTIENLFSVEIHEEHVVFFKP